MAAPSWAKHCWTRPHQPLSSKNGLLYRSTYHSAIMHGPTGCGAVQSNHGTVNLKVSSVYCGGKTLPVQATVLPKVTLDVGLPLADSKFGIPRSIVILLGANIFSRAVIQGLVLGLPGTPSKINTCFCWALTGTVRNVCVSMN